ncbi:hypothetical protein PVPAM_130012600 [Plasmodium vivax]|nr:hypothetical protein PVPAM_130012600 [Plasmodium vivax]
MNIPEISLYNKLYNDEDTTSINIDEFFEGCEECKTTNSLKRYVSKIAKYYDDLKNCLNSDSNEKFLVLKKEKFYTLIRKHVKMHHLKLHLLFNLMIHLKPYLKLYLKLYLLLHLKLCL